MTIPTYRNWERFWELHLTPQFRSADLLSPAHSECTAIESLDSLRGFFSALAGSTGDAPVAVSVNAVYVNIANHLAANHALELHEESGYTDDDLANLAPVIDQLYDSVTPGILILVRSRMENLN
jgi:hypothetical protein